ncbi:MAG: hypothetical protein KGI50_06595 [Patescibacteria group bacterium]|nr:hypothetical protein [Patescibacteria group bacterium]MDE2439119.1 hypothetical protein [Patescibacteria group bacterium]
MNLQTTLELYSGGPGSGCTGSNCGRSSTGGAPQSLTDFQKNARQASSSWTVEGPFGASYGLEKHWVKDLGRGKGIARVIVHEAAPYSANETGRPATYVQAQWQRRSAGKYESPTKFNREAFLYDEKGNQVKQYLQKQYGISNYEPFYHSTMSELAKKW